MQQRPQAEVELGLRIEGVEQLGVVVDHRVGAGEREANSSAIAARCPAVRAAPAESSTAAPITKWVTVR
ncbi:hypothetical protein GCM10020254_75740 [Streptomyces goshikiensis]